jgi:hypothetical protein
MSNSSSVAYVLHVDPQVDGWQLPVATMAYSFLTGKLYVKTGYLPTAWSIASGSGDGTVQSVTGDGVDNTDPANPVITAAEVPAAGMVKSNGTSLETAVAGVDYLTQCGLTLVERKTILLATDTITFSGLSGDSDEVYVAVGQCVGGTGAVAGTDALLWLPNGSSSNTSSGGYRLAATPSGGGLIQIGSATLAAVAVVGGDGFAWGFNSTIAAKTGMERTLEGTYRNYDSTANNRGGGQVWCFWSDKNTPITSMAFAASTAGHKVFGVGSIITLYKMLAA